MTVGELRKILEGVPDDHLVVLSRDPEGNGFKEADGWSDGGFDGEDFRLRELTPALKEAGYTEEDCNSDAPPCILLWPG